MSDQRPHKNSSDYEKYFSGNLSDAEKRAFEENLGIDSFEAEALEGFNSLEDSALAASAIKDIKKQVAKRTGLKKESKLVFPLWKSLGIAASVLLFLVAGFFINDYMTNKPLVVQNETVSTPEFESENSESLTTNLEDDTPVFQDSLTLKEPIAEKLEEELDELTKEKRQNNQDAQLISDDEVLNARSAEPEEISEDSQVSKETIESNDSEDESIPLPNSIVSAAKRESTNAMGSSSVEQSAQTTIDQPEERVNSYFEKGKKDYGAKKYKEAIVNFQNSLQEEQRVVESNYYTAMSYYNMNKATKAIKYFDLVLENNGSVLRYNAMWYKAVILEEKGELNEAKALLEQLAKGSSGFKNQAEDKLKSFN